MTLPPVVIGSGSGALQIPVWLPGWPYQLGDLVVPTTALGKTLNPPTNPNFDTGINDWTADAAYSWDGAYQSAYAATGAAAAQILNSNQVAVVASTTVINASCTFWLPYRGPAATIGGTLHGGATGFCRLVWYNASHVQIGTSDGTAVSIVYTGYPYPAVYYVASVQGTAPVGAAFCAIAAVMNTTAGDAWVDTFTWDYTIPGAGQVQYFTCTTAGTSGATEPTWPTSGTVADGSVIWTYGTVTYIEWSPSPFCKSASVEPTWGTAIGGTSSDGNTAPDTLGVKFNWVCQTPQVQDKNCPQARYVVLASSKIFSGDNDIVRYSATSNPVDWTSEADAGFLPYGLQTYGANPVTAMGLYRSNLVVFNAEGMQMWQLDEDPSNMSLLTSLPIGSLWHKALAPTNNDLFFLAQQGVRTMGITGASGNLDAGDVGMPVDPLVQAALLFFAGTNSATSLLMSLASKAFTVPAGLPYGSTSTVIRFRATSAGTGDWMEGTFVSYSGTTLTVSMDALGPTIGTHADWVIKPTQEPIATYFPSMGQYWLHFPGWQASGLFKTTAANTSNVLVYTMSRAGEVGAWSRYNFPFKTIDAFCQLNDQLYIRAGDDVLLVDPTALYDYASDNYLSSSRQAAFAGVVQWPWLDFGTIGVTKQLHSIDVSSTQGTSLTVEIGYDQADLTAYTTSFTVPGDTYYGTSIPIPIASPSFSVRLSMTSTDNWQIEAVNVYLRDSAVMT